MNAKHVPLPELEASPDHAGSHEPPRVGTLAIAGWGCGLAALVAGTLFSMSWLVSVFQADLAASLSPEVQTEMTEAAMTEPKVESDQPEQLAALRSSADARLHSYGTLEGDAGFAHVPIDRAIELVVENGLPFGKASSKKEQPETPPKHTESKE
jgi:hypothetical protein